MGEMGRMVQVCSNDFSRCYRVMAYAMTLTLRGLSACLGTGCFASNGALLGIRQVTR
jgi:hypothetical protein